jgi:predicted nuclease with TOPRIM domain
MPDPAEPEDYADEAFETWVQRLVVEHREGNKTIDRLQGEASLLAEALHRAQQKAAGLDVEHDIQRQMLVRLGIAWTPGEPFYSLVEAEFTRLRALLEERRSLRAELTRVEGLVERRNAEIEQLANAWDDSLAEVRRLKDLLGRMLASDDAVQMAWSKEIGAVLDHA